MAPYNSVIFAFILHVQKSNICAMVGNFFCLLGATAGATVCAERFIDTVDTFSENNSKLLVLQSYTARDRTFMQVCKAEHALYCERGVTLRRLIDNVLQSFTSLDAEYNSRKDTAKKNNALLQ